MRRGTVWNPKPATEREIVEHMEQTDSPQTYGPQYSSGDYQAEHGKRPIASIQEMLDEIASLRAEKAVLQQDIERYRDADGAEKKLRVHVFPDEKGIANFIFTLAYDCNEAEERIAHKVAQAYYSITETMREISEALKEEQEAPNDL